MENKTYRIAPYENERWNWLFSAGAVTVLVWAFSDFLWFDMPGWGYAVIFAVSSLVCGLVRIRQRGVELMMSQNGIKVCNNGKETVPLTPWSTFECGYIVKIYSYEQTSRIMDTYFLLTGKPLDAEKLDRISFDLTGTKPCGIWKDYIAVKTGKYDNQTIRNTVGKWLRIEEFVYDTSAYEDTEE